MVHYLIQEDAIYRFTINSIVQYSGYNCIRNNQQEKLVDVLENIREHIMTNDCLVLSLKCYYLLFQKLRDNFLNQECNQLKIFFKLWENTNNKTHNKPTNNQTKSTKNIPSNKIHLESIL